MSSVNMKKLGTRRKQELQTALVFCPIAQLNRQQEFLQLIARDPHLSFITGRWPLRRIPLLPSLRHPRLA